MVGSDRWLLPWGHNDVRSSHSLSNVSLEALSDALHWSGPVLLLYLFRIAAEKGGILNLGLKTQEAVSDSGAGFETRGHVRCRAAREQLP